MADDQQVVRSVSWTEVFSFTHIFKSFRMAIHPGKLILALAAILLCYGLGKIMDCVWSGASDAYVVIPREAQTYWTANGRADFLNQRDAWLAKREGTLVGLMTAAGIEKDKAAKAVADDLDDAVGDLKDALKANYEKTLKAAEEAREQIKSAEIPDATEAEKAALLVKADKALQKARWDAFAQHVAGVKAGRRMLGKGIFDGFLDWEMHCLDNALASLRRGNVAGGIADLYESRGRKTAEPYRTAAVTNAPGLTASTNAPEGLGVLGWLLLGMWGGWWLFSTYPLYAIIYLLAVLAVWSVLGGAICRVAALHAAREEKISMLAAVKFGLSKFFSFYSAPLLPVGILVGLGVCIGLAGLLGAIPVVGEWVFVVLFGLCLIAGAICAFLLIGLLAGWPLMWPTIAVEGSDSFDAISRSVSYVWNRPFRYGLYWLIAGVYGTVCYLFVRLFAFLTLRTVHVWGGWWMGWPAGREKFGPGVGKLDLLWAQPTFDSFYGQVQTEALSTSETGAAYVLAFIVYLVLGVVLAFLATFFFSAATNIYYLLRQKMDVTDLDDVYIEEEPEAEEEGAAQVETLPAEEPPAEEGEAEDKGEQGTPE